MIRRTLGLLPDRELKPAKIQGIRRRLLEVMIQIPMAKEDTVKR